MQGGLGSAARTGGVGPVPVVACVARRAERAEDNWLPLAGCWQPPAPQGSSGREE